MDLRTSFGEPLHIDWPELAEVRAIVDGDVAPIRPALRPYWDGLTGEARRAALDKLEIVQEVLTGFRDGHAELARHGEPRAPFGAGFGVSESARCRAMAVTLEKEAVGDRTLQRRIANGELTRSAPSESTVRNWVRAWKRDGLLGLLDARSLRRDPTWDRIDERYRAVADLIFDTLDGDPSTVSINEIDRRIRVELKRSGQTDLSTPQRLTAEYLAHRKRGVGATTRSQRSRSLQRVSGKEHFPAIRPGQIVAIDATRADNLVYDPLLGRAFSVEILTAIDVATRVILALRVVPRSANGIDTGLLLYDVCRPFSMTVDGTTVSDWRWAGLPRVVDASDVAVQVGRRRVAPDLRTLQGEHQIPSVMPDAIRADHGSIFVSDHFRAILRDLGIDLLLSRGKKPTDNPHVERWHETLQRAVQQLPGYKGRNTSERGRLVAEQALVTAADLEVHLRRFIALDYHRSWHTGLVIGAEPTARTTPLELWDIMLDVTGRIDVPQRADMIYQMLPVKWGTVGVAGVEFAEMVYDAQVLDDFRFVRRGRFREKDNKVPFFVDPHDLSRIWFRHPETGRVSPIMWRGSFFTDAPMTETIVQAVRRRIRERGGNKTLSRGSAQRQILEELTELTSQSAPTDWTSKVSAANRRVEQSRKDHAEALAFQRSNGGDDPHRNEDGVASIPIQDEPQDEQPQDLDIFEAPWPMLGAED
ncbi:transposase [Gordonia iterans]